MQPDWRPSEDGKQLIQAAHGLKMRKTRKDIQDQKLAIEEQKERVKGALRYSMILVGIKAHNMPDEEEKQVLINFVLQNFGDHTAEEVKMAFDMAVSGKLDVDATSYENFSPAFFSKVMNAFRKWASQEHRQISSENDKNKPEVKTLGAGEVDWSETWEGIIESAKTHAIYKMFIPTAIYDWLIRTCMINPSVEERKEAFRLAAIEYHEQMKSALLDRPVGYITTPEVKRRLDILNRGKYGEIMADHQLKDAIITLSKQQMVREHAIATVNSRT